MASEYVESKLRYIDDLFEYFESLKTDEKLKNHMANYLTVLISGTYEDMIENLIIEFVGKNNTKEEIENFVLKSIGLYFRNPDFANICNLIEKFDKDWSNKLKSLVDVRERTALDSIVNNKNNIAHTGQSSITLKQIKEYYIDSRKVIEKLVSIIFDSQ